MSVVHLSGYKSEGDTNMMYKYQVEIKQYETLGYIKLINYEVKKCFYLTYCDNTVLMLCVHFTARFTASYIYVV